MSHSNVTVKVPLYTFQKTSSSSVWAIEGIKQHKIPDISGTWPNLPGDDDRDILAISLGATGDRQSLVDWCVTVRN